MSEVSSRPRIRVAFGRAIASAALERGDRVVATARQFESVADLGADTAIDPD